MQIQVSLLLDRSRGDTLTAQLVGQLRDAIRLGRIAPGIRLPSSRRLSEQLGIGRNTVVRAYETLAMECFVECRPASGIFAAVPPSMPSRGVAVEAAGAVVRPVRAAVAPAARGRLSFDFAPGCANPALFPLKTWRRLLQTCLSQGGALGLAQPNDPFGLAALRSAIANHIAASRGIVAEPGQIIIVSGAAEAIALAVRLFVVPGAVVCVENPGYRPAAAAFQAAGAALFPVAVDEAGVVVDELPAGPAALLSVTPSHQFPTGHTMTPDRREAVVAWARRSGAMILEDDHGSEFRYEGGAPPAIAAYAPDRVIYLGSFSQSLGSGLRLGFMVVPAPLVDAVRPAKALLNSGSPWLEQAAVAEMIRGGSYASHLMRMRLEYRERRDHLLEALRRNFGEVEVSGAASGLHVFWQLPAGVPDAATVQALGRRARVGVYALEAGNVHHTAPSALARRGLILGYATLTPRQIDAGIARLSDAVDDALDGRTIGLGDLLVHRTLPSARRAAGLPRRRPGKPVPRGGKPALPNRQQPALPVAVAGRAASGDQAQRGLGKTMPVVTGLYQYPVKGLSPQAVARVLVTAGKPFPFDRLFALARPGVAVTAEDPKWAKKGLFVMLMLDEALASVRTHLDPETLRLTVREGDRLALSADLGHAGDRAEVEAFFHRLAPTLRAAPVLVQARDGHFMDKPDNVVSLINLATVRALEQQWSVRIDPLRFRANIYVDDAPAWAEFDWVGSDIRIGDGVFSVDRRNGRCSATNVDPASGRRDLDIPSSLRRAFGHKDLGVYLVVRTDAALAVGDLVDLPGVVRGLPAAAPAMAVPASGAFICRGCYYVYTEAQGAPAIGVVAGTRFRDLPAAWQCPDCGTDTTKFRPVG